MKPLKYWWALFRIHARKNRRLAQLWLATRFVKTAFWICPDLEKEMNAALRRERTL